MHVIPAKLETVGEHDIRRRKPLGQEIRARQPRLHRAKRRAQPRGQQLDHHRRGLRRIAQKHPVEIEVLEQTAHRLGIGQHLEIPPPRRRPRQRRQRRLGMALAEALHDGRALKENLALPFERRHPPRRREREILRRAQRLVEGMRHHLERHAELVQQPERAHRAGLRTVMQRNHAPSSASRRTSAAPAST